MNIYEWERDYITAIEPFRSDLLICTNPRRIELPEPPDHYRGFAIELREEIAGRPVYPLWDHLPVDNDLIYIRRG